MLDTGATIRLHRELPIFRLEAGDDAVLYVPGKARLTTRALALEVEAALAGGSDASMPARELATELTREGLAAARAWRELATRPFAPECLTLYLSNRCNLACSYCYANPEDETRARRRLRVYGEQPETAEFPVLSRPAIAAAARLVAGYCAAKEQPLTLVLHGGGEPTLHWDLLTWAWETCSAIAAEQGLRLWSYLATHGVIAEERVSWLARHFDLVGLSCDGPPRLQNANRPSGANTPTAAAVERTAAVLQREGAAYVVRATITPAAVASQTEIVEYLCDRLFARSVRFEPVYDGRRAPGSHFQAADADAFVTHFLAARRAARARGCELELSGVRIDEIHGPFCNPLREVLQLTPDGKASACFLSVGNDAAADAGMAMGHLEAESGRFLIETERVAAQRRQAARIPARCEQCHNVYHCARDCPDVCYLAEPWVGESGEGFRCRVQKLLGRELILEAAGAYSLDISGVAG